VREREKYPVFEGAKRKRGKIHGSTEISWRNIEIYGLASERTKKPSYRIGKRDDEKGERIVLNQRKRIQQEIRT